MTEKAREDRAGWSSGELLALLPSLGFGEVEDLGRDEIRSRYLGLPPSDRPGGGAHVVRARVVPASGR